MKSLGELTAVQMIGRAEIRESIEFFFDVIEKEHSGAESETRLRIALDRLAVAVNSADYTFDENDYPDAPRREYEVIRTIVSPRFPDCGYYNVVLNMSEEIGNGQAGVGDAIDDICDIAADLEEVLWRWDNNSVDDALWYFSNFYAFHWGRHLRELQLYLYDKTT